MRIAPPANLVKCLVELQLATPEQFTRVATRAARLAGKLADFESVWVDALAHARILTPWQAAEINAGRAESLRRGSYLLTGTLAGPGYAECFTARSVDTTGCVRLYVVRQAQVPAEQVMPRLRELLARLSALDDLPVLLDAGTDGDAFWVTTAPVSATSAFDWMVENGRFPPAAVLQIARDMAAQLARYESAGIVHGDLSTKGLALTENGQAQMPAAGLRGIVRPQEGYSFGELRPDAYDYLAPERIAAGVPPDSVSDLYACGAVWWHLLSGRPPFGGGNSLAKLKAVHAARVVDIRAFAPAIPDLLSQAVMSCLSVDRRLRPHSFRELADRLGPPTPAGQHLVASLIRKPEGTWHNLRVRRPHPTPATGRNRKLTSVAVAASLAVLVATPLAWIRPNIAPSKEEFAVAEPLVPLVAPEPSVQPTTDRPTRLDPQVRPVAATEPVAFEGVVEDLVLPTDKVLQVEQLDLEPNLRVRGRGGRRATVSVPTRGLTIPFENVSFEGIDFVWRERATVESPSEDVEVMLRLAAQTVNFRNCSFSSRASHPPAVLRIETERHALSGLGCEVFWTHCVFDGVNTVVDHASDGKLALRLENCLCVASGPILRLPGFPRRDESIRVRLDRVTTRGDASVLAVANAQILGPQGTITIDASDSAFASSSRGGLITLENAASAETLQRIVWTGEGSVVTPRTSVVTEYRGSAYPRPIADEELNVAGLVRGELEFSGPANGPPSSSTLLQWQAPLRSPEPPGADASKLHSPRSPRVK